MSVERAQILRLNFECLRSIPGGVNEVRLWWDEQLGCHRVGKRFDLSCLDDVLPEPATLQMIEHANVVGVIAASPIEDEELYPPPMRVIELITPYFPRGSITDALLRGEHFSPTRSVQIVQAMLQGLSNLHDVHGIAHRDIKSGNVLLTDDKDPAIAKICDLGLAGLFDESNHVPALNNPTLYSPPEFKYGGLLTRAAELYPVALILLELLKGPFDYAGYSTRDIVRQLSEGRHPTLKSDRQPPIWASRPMRRFLAKSLQTDPVNRFQSAREMSNSLAKVACIDWIRVNETTWEAPFLFKPGRRIRVSARTGADGSVELATQIDAGSGWRQAIGTRPQTVQQLESSQGRAVFDQATTIAIAR
ncbi:MULTISPECIES: protein kinase [Actinomycetes]|uniref:protein kinase domain-containing protein n=1 Tax=Actinomycetes TaxID=1760 RepID=UPI0004BF5947|nr:MULTISPECIES: protein kinase [Actinomycetes]